MFFSTASSTGVVRLPLCLCFGLPISLQTMGFATRPTQFPPLIHYGLTHQLQLRHRLCQKESYYLCTRESICSFLLLRLCNLGTHLEAICDNGEMIVGEPERKEPRRGGTYSPRVTCKFIFRLCKGGLPFSNLENSPDLPSDA